SPVSASCDVVVTRAQASAGDFAVKALDEQSIMITKYTGSATDVTIPSTIDGRKVTTIGEKAFFESNIARVTIPEGVTAIERVQEASIDTFPGQPDPIGARRVQGLQKAAEGQSPVV
ncbi:MAG: hypothetical protein RR739_08050, partial [Clostridia bacterium]